MWCKSFKCFIFSSLFEVVQRRGERERRRSGGGGGGAQNHKLNSMVNLNAEVHNQAFLIRICI